NMSFVGIWAADARACSALDRSGFLLTVIDTDGARAGETLCAFESKRQTKLGWDVVARCSNSHERWTANVSLSVKDNRLSWKSQRGTETYLRCQREEMMAQAQQMRLSHRWYTTSGLLYRPDSRLCARADQPTGSGSARKCRRKVSL